MRKLIVGIALIATACGGKLSDEQRKELREGVRSQAIQKVTEAEIVEAAFKTGREVMKQLEKVSSKDSLSTLDSLQKKNHIRIHWLAAGSANALDVEQQIIDAYVMSAATGNDQPDNVQAVKDDSLLYTKPAVEPMPDGAVFVKGTWNIWMSRKELVLSLNKE